ncbi:M56 family metallopeptidase [Dyadobacter crusticola]|uniref:M56 family metallopeptidase n=1 Tax=Dyadobacter crusticola TaxID=292407 RepID=UPI00069229FF|nr:M56 family metallopeptidase [Dyadobacter crusticola]
MTSYIIKSVLCSGILIAVYHLFLEREKMLRFNRGYLLLALLFSLGIPLVSFEIKPETPLEPVAAAFPVILKQMQDTAALSPVISATENNAAPDFMQYVLFAFEGIGLLLLVRFLINVIAILKLKSHCRRIPFSGAKLVLVPQDIVTYTFLDNIFIPKKSFENKQIRSEILTHELAHARQMHSVDILFIELVHALMWFNPFLLFYKKAIRLNHEFLADEAVLKEFSDVKSYQLLLLDSVLQKQFPGLISSFNYSITKKRLAMMTKLRNLNRQYLKQAVAVLLSMVLTIVFSEKVYAQVKAGGEQIAAASPEVSLIAFEDPKHAGDQHKVAFNIEMVRKVKSGPGASQNEITELYSTVAKYTTYLKTVNGRIDPVVRMPAKLRDRMFALVSKMNQEQLLTTQDSGLFIYRANIPIKESPSPEMFEKWKRADVFGVWIDGRKVPNSALNKYKHTDIVEFWSSKLYGGALKGRSYKYQLDLTTDQEFDRTFKARVEHRVSILRLGWVGERPKTFKRIQNF